MSCLAIIPSGDEEGLSGSEVRFLKQLDITQAQLGRYVGLSHQQVSSGRRRERDYGVSRGDSEAAGVIISATSLVRRKR
jgi:hypothetical protein